MFFIILSDKESKKQKQKFLTVQNIVLAFFDSEMSLSEAVNKDVGIQFPRLQSFATWSKKTYVRD